MSLKDQLLKAGLVTKKQVQKVESQKRKQDHDSKKDKILADELAAKEKLEFDFIEAEKRKRHELDKELNKQRDALISKRENHYRAIQTINSQSLNLKEAVECYFFEENNFVRKILVTPWQREMLARGKFAITRPYEDCDEFVLVPLATAKLLQNIYPEKIIMLHSEIDDNSEID